MNNKLGKQIIFAILILIISIVIIIGVSFGFFSYIKKGSSNNQITTGTISFSFVDGDTIHLTNHFPISTEAGIGLTGENNICTFNIKGYTSATAIDYQVSAVEGEKETGKTRFRDSEVFIHIESITNDDGITFVPTPGYEAGKAIGSLPLVLGSGSVSSETEVNRAFTVRMWVDSSVVEVGEGKTYSFNDYSNLYYSMKIKVNTIS